MPIFTAYFFTNYYKKLTDEEFDQRFGSLYVNIRADNRRALNQVVLYFIRRLIYAALIVFFPDNPDVQFIGFIISSGSLLAFQFYALPMDDRQSQILEIYNESTILFCGLLLAPFFADAFDVNTDGQGQERYNFGWMMIGTVIMNIAVNQIAMMVTVAKKIYKALKKAIKKIKKKLEKCKKKKAKKEGKDKKYKSQELESSPPPRSLQTGGSFIPNARSSLPLEKMIH